MEDTSQKLTALQEADDTASGDLEAASAWVDMLREALVEGTKGLAAVLVRRWYMGCKESLKSREKNHLKFQEL